MLSLCQDQLLHAPVLVAARHMLSEVMTGDIRGMYFWVTGCFPKMPVLAVLASLCKQGGWHLMPTGHGHVSATVQATT